MSTENKRRIAAGLKELSSTNLLDDRIILQAKVVSVKDDNTAKVTVDGLEINDVQLRPIDDGSNQAMVIVPKQGSMVLIGSIDGLQDYVVLMVDVAEKVLIKVGDVSVDILKNSIKLNGDQYGGMVKVDSLVSECNAIRSEFNKLKQALMAWVPVPSDGGAALKAVISSFAAESMIPAKKTDFENKNVKHG